LTDKNPIIIYTINSDSYESAQRYGRVLLETYYSLLGIERNATKKEIKKAYRRMAMKYHPDKVHELGEKIKTIAEIEFKRINIAKDALLDDFKRKEYDEKLGRGSVVDDGLDAFFYESGKEISGFDPKVYKEEIGRLSETIDNLKNIIISLQFGMSSKEDELELERKRRMELKERMMHITADLVKMSELLSEGGVAVEEEGVRGEKEENVGAEEDAEDDDEIDWIL